jgi:hypothetical protein
MSRATKTGSKEQNGITFDVMECTVGENEEKKIEGVHCSYMLPATWVDYQKLFTAATTEPEQKRIMDAYAYGHGLKARSEARPDGGGVTLPVIGTKRWGNLNLVDGTFGSGLSTFAKGDKVKEGTEKWSGTPMALPKRVAIINVGLQQAREMEAPVLRGVSKAIEELVASKAVTVEKSGDLKLAKPVSGGSK